MRLYVKSFSGENPMTHFPPQFQELIVNFSAAFGSTPTADSFLSLVLGWILCNARRTVSGVVRAAGPEAKKSHDAYQNFFSKSQWSMDDLWKMLFLLLVEVFVKTPSHFKKTSCPTIWLAGDDTLSKHYGRKIWGAGLYRDATRSSKKHTVYAWGLNWVVLAMVVKVPLFKDRYIALPICARLNPKSKDRNKAKTKKTTAKNKAKGKASQRKKTTVSIMDEMIKVVAHWQPEMQFLFCGDGAYASVARDLPENVHLVSRMRRDGKLFAPPPKKRKNNRGRWPKKGKRLPSPLLKAMHLKRGWKKRRIEMYGEIVNRLLYSFDALWYDVCPDSLIKIVIVRDPNGEKDDEFFFSTNLAMTPCDIVHCYSTRWAIEVVFREIKQYLGSDQPQARKKMAVLRIMPFCLWLNSVIKLWFVVESTTQQPVLLESDPWYAHKETISFQDMLGALRLHFWQDYISTWSTSEANLKKIGDFLVKSLAKVA